MFTYEVEISDPSGRVEKTEVSGETFMEVVDELKRRYGRDWRVVDHRLVSAS